MKTQNKNSKPVKTTATKKHSFATDAFLVLLAILPIITVFGTIASFAVFSCDTNHDSCTNNPSAGGLWILATILAFAALYAWFKNQHLLSIRLSKILLAIPSVAGIIAVGAMLLGSSPDLYPEEVVITILLSAVPILILISITTKQPLIIKEAKSITSSFIAKALFVTQLLIFTIISAPSMFDGCANAECTKYDPLNFFFFLILTLCNVFALLAWIVKKRTLSVRLSQIGLTSVALGIIWEFTYAIWMYSLTPLVERAKIVEFYSAPYYLLLTLLVLSVPFICLYLVTRYKKQIVED